METVPADREQARRISNTPKEEMIARIGELGQEISEADSEAPVTELSDDD